MKLDEVLKILAPFGIHEDEIKKLLGQPRGWEEIQSRVRKTFDALLPYFLPGEEVKLEQVRDEILGLKLKSTKKSLEQEEKERCELADKLKGVGKEKSPFGSSNPTDIFGDFGDFFGGLGKK